MTDNKTSWTAEQQVKHLIALKAIKFGSEIPADLLSDPDAAYEYLVENDEHWDAVSETRCGEVETDIPAGWSRHYESKSVAALCPDGSWVGWTYWYGGGKHADPEAIDWIDQAYALDCTEEQKTVTVRTFTKTGEAPLQ
ncbi:hypothetical protein [Caenibius sp. WL]|uniref:hypothetical protein n=1 Tax=Caenibius sp. WL TaxID=2872646 RepID=UPI001C99D435|nr:hypothetical protein [Caenibius sp. WL]QZP06844.1 hypothetical protein K5X80_08890 [Caenibius sp. WL]